MSKYNWKALEKEYLLGDYKSINAFLKEKNIPRNGSTNKSTKGWKEKKQKKEIQKSNKIVEKVIEKQAEKEANEIVSVNHVADKLLRKILEATDEINIKTDMFGNEYVGIVDRADLKKLTSALKDVSDIIDGKKDSSESTFINDIEKAWGDRNEKRSN